MKDWSKERWRRLYLREALEQRLWPVLTRGLRDYLIRLAEDDGALIRDSDDPVEDLLRGLGAHPGEAELVRAAIELLRRDGFLTGTARSIFVRNLPAAQAWEPREKAREAETPLKRSGSSSSKERVRQFRERQRLAANVKVADTALAPDVASDVTRSASDSVTAPVSGPVTSVTRNVTDAVTRSVTSSRGSRNLKPSENFLDLQRNKQADHHPSSARASGVTSAVTNLVTSATAAVTSRASSESAEDEDEDESNFLENPEELRKLPVGKRAAQVRELPALAAVTRPESWPEVVSVAKAFARSAGQPEPRLGQYDRDPGVRALVALYAAGFTQLELERVAQVVPKQAWWAAAGKRVGLSSLTIEVVRRNLPDAGPCAASPTVAKVLADVQKRREAG